MALSWIAQKIFGQKENVVIQPQWAPKVPEHKLDQQNCRLLLLRESSHGHKSLLYDSNCLKECSEGENYDIKINDTAFKIESVNKENVKDLAERIYGTLPIANQSDTIKVCSLFTLDRILSCVTQY